MEAEKLLRLSIEALLILAILGYLGINFTAQIPRAIIAENITYAAAYAIILAGIVKGLPHAFLTLIIIASINAGRVSRSIWDPLQGWGPLALQHMPLLILLLLLSLLPALYLAKLLPR